MSWYARILCAGYGLRAMRVNDAQFVDFFFFLDSVYCLGSFTLGVKNNIFFVDA